MYGFFENNGIASDLYHIAVEYWIVLPQEVGLLHGIHYDSDHAAIGLHYTFQGDLIDRQAALAGAASRSHHRLADYRANKWIAAAGDPDVLLCRTLGLFVII